MRFVVKVLIRDSARASGVVQTRYIGTDAANGSEAIAAAKEQMEAENEPGEGKSASYHAKPCPPGASDPWE